MQFVNKIIFTVPHFVCREGTTRQQKICDLNAGPFTKLVTDLCQDIDHVIIYSEQNRRVLDDNRFSTGSNTIVQDSPLWIKLREEVKKYHDEHKSFDHLLILDMHSFYIEENLDMYFLELEPNQEITVQLNKHLIDNGFRSEIMRNQIGSNSITNVHTLHPVPIRSILVEVSEYITDERLKEMAKHFSDFLHSIYKKENGKLQKENDKSEKEDDKKRQFNNMILTGFLFILGQLLIT